MKLICNLSMFTEQPTGLGVYADRCLDGLSKRLKFGLIAGDGKLPDGEIMMRAPKSIGLARSRFSWLRRYLWLKSLSFTDEYLVYSPTHHALPNQNRQIITVHDLIPLRFPKAYPHAYLYLRFSLPNILKKCRAVFTVSETSKIEISKTYNFPLGRIFVTPSAIDTSQFTPAPFNRIVRDQPYLLMVSGRPHKNVFEVISMSEFWKDKYNFVIVSCPQGILRRKLQNMIKELGLQDKVVFKDYVSQQEILTLYQNASALLQPSFIEGFGLPPLEAFACNVPAIVSDIPAHREVLGDSPFYIKHGDKNSWKQAFSSLEQSKLVVKHLELASERLKTFTWTNATDALERALLEVEPSLEECRR
jgi:glycosyltransferase involved in cell wall biosynthesis